MRFQTLPNPAVRARARRLDPALILLTGVDASFDFNYDLHSASLCAAAPHCATLSEPSTSDLFHFRVGNFLTSSVIIVPPFPEIDCERTRFGQDALASLLLCGEAKTGNCPVKGERPFRDLSLASTVGSRIGMHRVVGDRMV